MKEATITITREHTAPVDPSSAMTRP